MDKLKNRKTTCLKGADYNRNQAVFLTICTKERKCILSHIVGTGVPDAPFTDLSNSVGTGVPDAPFTDISNSVGTGVPDGPFTDLSNSVGTGVPDGPKIELTKYGQIADKYINQLNDFYDSLSVESYVIMPNHIHVMLWVKGTENGPARTPVINGPSRTPVPTIQNSVLSRFVSTFKRFCNKEYGTNIWQYRSNDHIIRSLQDYEEHLRYIYENPMRWYYDELYTEE